MKDWSRSWLLLVRLLLCKGSCYCCFPLFTVLVGSYTTGAAAGPATVPAAGNTLHARLLWHIYEM